MTTRDKDLILTASQVDYLVLDASSSMTMDNRWYESLSAIDAYIDTVKSRAVDSQVILTSFTSGAIGETHRNTNIRDWVPLRDAPIACRGGMTPLYDAINAMGRDMRELNPDRAAITIVTDGGENESATSLAQAKAILDWCRAHGWQVTFIGCDFNNQEQARLLGATPDTSVGVHKARLTDAAKALGEKRARYGHAGQSMGFSDDEKEQFGGFLNAPA